jgi:hypothetical protein
MRLINEKYNYNSAYTINTPYKWYGCLMDRLGLDGIGQRAGKTDRKKTFS